MTQTKGKYDSLVLSRSDLWMIWIWHGVLRVHCHYFCLELTVRKNTWIGITFLTVVVIFFRKLVDHSYIQSPFSTITRHIDNSILKRYPYILRTWINICAKSFIKTSVNIVKQKWRRYLKKDQCRKNSSAHFKEHFAKINHVSPISYGAFSIKPSFWI